MKIPVFYCEKCNKPVSGNVTVCPYCGLRFDAVRCPICSYTNKEKYFRNGCPECGYLKPVNSRKSISSSEGRNASTPPRLFYRTAIFFLILSIIVMVVYISLKA